jgi:hypothetical protein
MGYLVSWLLVLALLAFWSLFAWAVHALTAWSAANAAALASQGKAIEELTAPAWLAAWLPAEWLAAFKAMAAAMMPVVDAMLALLPSLAGAMSVLIWVLWGLGVTVLLVLGAVLHGLIAMWRRRQQPPAAPPGMHAPVH